MSQEPDFSFLWSCFCLGFCAPPPTQFPCRNHGANDCWPCVCGLDKLQDGDLNFPSIAEDIQALWDGGIDGDEIHVAADTSQREDYPDQTHIGHARIYSYEELRRATNSFHPSQILGAGGYGSVYLGKLQDGQKVAVKVLNPSDDLEHVSLFTKEVIILSSLRHKNLITLLGCSSPASRKFLLVYEYVTNGSVAGHLHGGQPDSEGLTWNQRIQIATETAEALAHLHSVEGSTALVHGDVKPDNILLDDAFHVKVADFGLIGDFNAEGNSLLVVPQRGGSPGYVDPEHDKDAQLTDKSDVYSFGVVLMELISGQKDVDFVREEVYLADMALKKIQNKELDQFVDTKLGYHSDPEIERMVNSVVELACKCLQQERMMRPPMLEVVKILKGINNETQHVEEPSGGLNQVDVAENAERKDLLLQQDNLPNIERILPFLRRTLQEGGYNTEIRLVCRRYGHRVSSTVLFYLFKDHMVHANDVFSKGITCQCRFYLQNNEILHGAAQSMCFGRLIANYTMYLAVIKNTPAHVAQRYFNRVFGSALVRQGPNRTFLNSLAAELPSDMD